jgi:soluble lytic murein transglycosylase
MRDLLLRNPILLFIVSPIIMLALTGMGIYWQHYRRSEIAQDRMIDYSDIIWDCGQEYLIPPELIKAIIRTESNCEPKAVSAKGAVGLMQITRIANQDVCETFNVSPGDLYDPAYNILIGTAYLRLLHKRFKGEWILVVAAYHAGPGKVMEWQAAAPDLEPEETIRQEAYPSTRRYVAAVLPNK